MTSFAEKVAAAKAAPRLFRDVTVSLDTTASGERAGLVAEREALLNPADKRMSRKIDTSELDAKLAEIEERERASAITLRFFKVPGDEWANLTAANPARDGALVDLRFGYNMHAVCRASAVQHGRTLEGDVEEFHTGDEWAELWSLLGGAEFASVCDAIYALNEWEPAQRVERLKNFSEAATASAKK